MAEVILNLPLQRGRPQTQYHKLFVKISDGQVWKITRDDYKGTSKVFRVVLQNWARHRNMKAVTRIAEDGSVAVQVEKIV